MAPNGPDCWPKGDSLQQWLVFYRLNDMTLTGSGTIEGNGENWWSLPCKPHRVFNLIFVSGLSLSAATIVGVMYVVHTFVRL